MTSRIERTMYDQCRISVLIGFIVVLSLRGQIVCGSGGDTPTIGNINDTASGIRTLPDLSHLHLDENIPEQYRVAAKRFGILWKEHLSNFKGHTAVKGAPFTLIVPDSIDEASFGNSSAKIEEFLFDHAVPGALVEIKDQNSYVNLNQRAIHINLSCINMLMAYEINQSAKVLTKRNITESLSMVFIVGNLTDSGNQSASTSTKLNKRNIQENDRYNEPQRLEMKDVTKEQTSNKENRIGQHLLNFLNGMKSGVRVFQHFFSNSNLSKLTDDSGYMVFIPSDTAFQRWHPIDWGFYPFSVQEFTESVLRNHLVRVKQPLRMTDLRSTLADLRYKTIGGEYVTLQSKPSPSVNNASILFNYTLSNDIEVYILAEVLFVSEAVVSRLHQMHKDKETPPLLAFPWFGAQFLSHSFLALERDNRFTQITRFLNIAEIAQFISGSNYTFFVPTDEAFERHNFDLLPDNMLASEKAIKMLLNHFIRGRLYDRDLKDGEVIETIGEKPIKIERSFENVVHVNNARIVESEVFVYNLGTMFYVNDILHPNQLSDEIKAFNNIRNTDGNVPDSVAGSDGFTTEHNQLENDPSNILDLPVAARITDMELMTVDDSKPGKLDNREDSLVLHEEIITPKEVPLKYFLEPKK